LEPDGQGSFSRSTHELGESPDETRRAVDEIMAAAESIEALASGIDPEPSAPLIRARIRIYEAGAFQDITGQRITKVIKALQQIEHRLNALAEACGHAVEDDVPRAAASPERATHHHLNGRRSHKTSSFISGSRRRKACRAVQSGRDIRIGMAAPASR
jgi:hypothetical protein